MATQDTGISQIIRSNVESLEEMNIRTFTRWINSKLGGKEPVVKDLMRDLQDGRVLLKLLEVLLKVKLPGEKGKLKFHKLNNVNKALKELEERGLKLHGISSAAIVDGNRISILGLIWIIILHFQVQGIVDDPDDRKPSDEPRKKSMSSQAEIERLLIKWVQEVLKEFSDVVTVNDILKSWQNGLAFIFLLFVYRPNAVDIDKAQKMSVLERLGYAFNIAEKEFEVHSLLDPKDVEQGNVDKKAMLMYLSALYEVLRNLEPAVVQTTSREVSEEPVEEGITSTTTSYAVESGPPQSTLRIGDEVVVITTVSSNEIVLQYKTVYYTILYTIKRLESGMEKIGNEEPSQESAKALREIQREMQELQEKIKELNDKNKEMSKADGVDRQEFADIQSELKDLRTRWSALIQRNNEENKRQPAIIGEVRTRRTVHTARLTIGEEVIEITSVSTNEIVIKYKIVYYQVITIIKMIETNMKVINEEEPSQKTARLLDENRQRMEQLQPKIVEMNELMSQMKDADGVDAEELSQLQSELEDFDTRCSTVTEHISAEAKRQPALVTETLYRTTTEEVESEPRQATSTTLRIGAEVVDITTVSTNEIVLQYKTIYYTILYTIKGLEDRMERIRNEEPSQENARALRAIQLEMQELQGKIKELNDTNKQMAQAEGVDRKEFSEIQTELGELGGRWSALIQHSKEENQRQPRIVTYKTTTTIVPRHRARLTIGDEVVEVTSVSTNEIVIKYKIVYYQIITIIKIIETNMRIINEEEPSQKTARLLDENRQRMEQLQPKIVEMNELMAQMKDADGVDAEELSQLQSELGDFDTKIGALNENISHEEKRQPELTSRTMYTVTTTIVNGRRTAQLRDGDKMIEFQTVSTNEIVMRYKIVYYEIITICELIETNTRTIQTMEAGPEKDRLVEENKQRMEELQPKITQLNELMSEMKDADGIDPDELSQLQYELKEFDSRMESVNEDTAQAPGRHTTVTYGGQVFEITTVSTNMIVVRYKILYYEIITIIKSVQENVAQIKDSPPSNTTAVMLKQNKDQMDEIQTKIHELHQLRNDMEGAEGVDAQEVEDLQAGLDSLDAQWDTLTHDVEAEDQRISSALDSSGRQKASLDEWRKKCESIGDWMDSIEDKVEVLETREPSSDIIRAQSQMADCDALQEKIESDEVPVSTFAYGEEMMNEASITPDQKSKIRLQIAEMKKEIGKLSDRSAASKHRYKRAIDKLEAEKKRKLANLRKDYQELDRQIDILKDKGDKIGAVEGDPAAVRAKETLIELLVSDIQVFQPRFDGFRLGSWEVLEDPTTDESDRNNLQKQVTSLEERWGALIRSVYSRSAAAKSLIAKLPQGGGLEELIILENQRYDFKIDWKAHHDLFGAPDGHDQDAWDEQIYRERLLTRWKRECREVDEALNDVERESSELGEILDDPNKSAMKKAKMEVIGNGLKKVEKEYQDLPEYAKQLLDDPKLTDEDRAKIQSDLDSYKIRHDEILKLVFLREQELKKQEPAKSTVVVTESYVTERKPEIIVPQLEITAESAPEDIFSAPDVPSNAEDVEKWWDEDRKVVDWITKVDDQVKQADNEPATLDLVTTRRQHGNIERITQEIAVYETNVKMLENKADGIVNDPVTRDEDRENVGDEMKTVKKSWDNLNEKAFNVERNLYEQVNKLQEYLSWTQKSQALSGWLEDTERSLDSCVVPSSNAVEREKQTLFLEKFLKERGQNQESVDDVLSHGNLVVNKNLVPEQHLENIKGDLKDYREKWNELLKKAEHVEDRLSTGKKDLQKLEENYKEYTVITTWIISNEKRLKELKDDTSGGDEGLKRRRVIILEIIEEITVYRIRLRRLIEDNESLADKDTLPPEDRDTLLRDTKDLEKRLDGLDNDVKNEESRLTAGEKDVQKLQENQREYLVITTWIINNEQRLKELKDDASGDDESLKRRRVIILEIIEEITVYRIRLRRLIDDNENLADKDTLPPEDRDTLVKDTKDLEKRLDDLDEKSKNEESSLNDQLDNNSTKLDDWQKKAEDLDKMFVTTKTEIESFSVPPVDDADKEKQKKYFEDFAKQKQETDDRVNDVVSSGRQLVSEGVIPSEKREKFEFDLESIPGNWDGVVNMAEESKTNLDNADKSSDDYDNWCKDAAETKELIEKQKHDVETSSQPTSDPEEHKRHITTITKIFVEKPKQEERVNETLSRGKDLQNNEYLTPEQKEHIARETKDIEVNWNDFTTQLDGAKTSVESGGEDLQNLAQYHVDYDVIITWITTNQKRLQEVRDDEGQDKESVEKQRAILKNMTKEFPEYKIKLREVIAKGEHLANSPSLPQDDKEEIKRQSDDLKLKLETLESDVDDEDKKLDANLKNLAKYESWQFKADGVKEKLDETKENLDKFDKPTSDVSEIETQKRFLNSFDRKKPAQEKAINDIVRDGQKMIDEDIVPAEKLEKVQMDLQSLPETWDGLVTKADEKKKTIDSSLQDAVQLSKWRTDYGVVLLWIEKAEEKQNQPDEDGEDLDKLKKERKRVETNVKDITKYEPKILPLVTKSDTISQSEFITPDDAKSAGDDGKALKERFDKLKDDETSRKLKLDEKIQWLTEFKQYRTEADGINVMLDETQKKLESCEKPTSNKAERDKQAAFLNKFTKEKPANDKRVDTVIESGNKLADAPGVPVDKTDEIKEETKTMGDTWRIIVLKVEELQKIVSSGIQNITELSEWRKEYVTVVKWVDGNEKRLTAQGEPGNEYKDLSNKCTTLDEIVNLLPTYETRVVLLLEKGDQLAKEPSIDEPDRKQTEDDTNALRERWDKLKDDGQDKKKRFDEQKSVVEGYRDWKDNVNELKPWLDETKIEMDACEQPTSDPSVREKQAQFIKVFFDDEEKNQSRVDGVVNEGVRLLKENPAAQKDEKHVKDTIHNVQNSWNTITQRLFDVEKCVTSGTQDIIKLEKWHDGCSQLNKSIENSRKQIRNLKTPSKDPAKMTKQKQELKDISSEMDDCPDEINALSDKAEYLIKTSSISPKDKDKVSHDLDQLNNTYKNYKNDEDTIKANFAARPLQEVVEDIQFEQAESLVVEGSFQDIEALFNEVPQIVDYGEWKNSVGELERILDEEDGKFDPKSDIEKEYSNLEKLAEETKVSGAVVDDECKPKLAKILSDGNALVNDPQLEPADKKEVTDKMVSLKDRTQRVDMAVRITRMKVRDAALAYFNDHLNECSVNVNKMQETAETLRRPGNDLPSVRIQLATVKLLQKRLAGDDAKVQDIEDKVNKMEDAGVLPRDGFAGTLNDRCGEVRKEQQNVSVSLAEAKPKLHRALLNQLNRTQKAVNKWLKVCEKKERNIDVSNVKDLDKAHQECLKLKQAKAEFDKGEPLYITLTEVHKEAVDDEILVEKKAVDFGKQMEGVKTRHDELKKRLDDKEIELHTFVRKSTEDVLNSAEEKLEEQKTWLEAEDPADNFNDAKEQQDRTKDREMTIKERSKDIVVQFGPVERIATGEILPLPESTALQRRVTEVKTKFNADIVTAKDKSQTVKGGYGELLKKEIQTRKAWLDDHEDRIPETDADFGNFKDFDEFKVKYDQNKEFVNELDGNNIEVLIEEAGKVDDIEPEVKDELKVLNERWDKIHDATKDKSDSYEDLMTKWAAFREQQLVMLNWVDAKDAKVVGEKDQVNLADEDEVAEHIQKLKDVKDEAELQGEPQKKKLKEAGDDLIRHLGEDSPAAEEINKQVEEVDSVRQKFMDDIGDKIEKFETNEQKSREMYNNIDGVTTWLDATEHLIDTYEGHEKQTADGDGSRDQTAPQEEVQEEMVHVVEEILAKRKEIPEKEMQLNNAVECVGQLEDQLDESNVEKAQGNVNEMKERWDVVTKRLDEFCNRDIPEIEIAEIKAENLEDESEDETDMSSVVPLEKWRERVRKVNLLLKYVERLVNVNVDGKMNYPSIRILASNTKEANKTMTSYCKPRAEVISKLGYNIINSEPHNIDQGEEITTTIDTLNKRIEVTENGATILKMKVRDLALDYFNNRFNNCEIALESEEENVNKLGATKPDLETTQEQMVLLKEGQKEFKKNQEDYESVVDELKDKKISEFLSKEGFQGTLGDKSDNIKKRRAAVEKKLSESKTRIHRNLLSHLTEMKKTVSKWLTSCEKKEKTINVEPSPTHDPVAEYKKLMALREELDEGEPKYDVTVQLNKQLMSDNVLEGRKATSSEKDLQSFATRFATLGKRAQDKKSALYTILLSLIQSTMDEVENDLTEANTKVDQTVLSERFPQVKQDFHNAKNLRNEVDEVCEKSKDSLKDVHAIIALDVFTDEDTTKEDDRRNGLKERNSQLAENSDEKFDSFARRYNEIIENVVKNRKMWLNTNESWLNINDNDVDDLPGFDKKLEEQKTFQEQLELNKMEGLLDEARDNEELSPDTRVAIYELDEQWKNLNDWSVERLHRLSKINTEWKILREAEKELVHSIDDNDARLKLISSPVNLSDKDETENQRNELKDLQSDTQRIGLTVVKVQKSSNDLIKLVGPDSSAGKRMDQEFNDLNTCHINLCNDTLARLKKLDASERKTKALHDHVDDVTSGMEESEDILKSLSDEMKQFEEKKDAVKEDEINENEEEKDDDEKADTKDKSPDLNKFVDQISLRLGERPEEKARVQRAKELETSLEEDLSDEAKNILQQKMEDFDNRWEDVSAKMDEAVKETAEEPAPVKTFQVQEVESLPEDQTVDFNLWKGDAAGIDESMLKSQTALQAYDVDVKDYPSLKKAETETQDIIDQMNVEFKPKLITLRSSGEKISDQDPNVTSDEVDDIVNSSQKNLEGLQSTLQLRKFRLRDTAVQHINERILDCQANVKDEQVKLELLTPAGKDLDTVLEQLSALQECEKTFHTNQVEFEEVQVHLNEVKLSKILTSPEFQQEFQDDCKEIAIERAQILKQTRDHKNKLYRAIVNIFEVRRKDITKWLKNCEKKEKEIASDVQNLGEALVAVKKIKETENVLSQGEPNYHETVELSKTVSDNEILVDKKAKDAENDMKNASARYNQVLEEVQNKKNKLYKIIHDLLVQQLDEKETEVKKGEDIVETESNPDDPTATQEELSDLQGVVDSSGQLKDDSGKLFDQANVLLSADIFPQDDKKDLRKRVIYLDKRTYDLPDAAKDKYEKVYNVYLSHLTTLIRLRTEWITANEHHLEDTDTTGAVDIDDLESKVVEHEEFENELKKNNVRSVLDQIRDTDEVDPEVPLSELLSLEKRWEVLQTWADQRKIFLQITLEKWKAFRQEEVALVAWIDGKDSALQELDTPVNLADENAVQERLETLKNLQIAVNQHSPNLDHFKMAGQALLQDLQPESEGHQQVKKQMEDFENCWGKLEKDIEDKIEKMEKSNRTIEAIYSYMDVVSNWLDDTDGKLGNVDSKNEQLHPVSGEHAVDGSSEKASGDELKEGEQEEANTGDESGDMREPKSLTEDEKEEIRDSIERIKDDIKTGSRAKDLQKARIDRLRLLVDDIHHDIDEEGVNVMEERLCEINERYEQIDTRLDHILQEEKPEDVPSEAELITVETSLEVHSALPEEQLPAEPTVEDTTAATPVGRERTPVEPYTGKVTLDLKEWRTVSLDLREFLHRMQMNIRDIDSKNYKEMRECEVDTKFCIDAMETYGRPCLNDLIVSANGMLDSPEYTEDEKNEIRATLESLTVGAQFVNYNAKDQRLRLYTALISYQNDQKKIVQRWLNSCTKESKAINEDVAGLEASDAEYKKVQHVKNTLASGEATFEHYKELSRRMIQNKIIPEKKIPEAEKDIVNFTTTYDNLRAETERKDKRLYITVEKSISLPLDSIELAVNEGDVWVQPQELSSEYVEAKEQLNKMKLSVFVIETLHTRSAKVLKETAALVSEHEYLTPEDKQIIVKRVHALSPRTESLPAAALNKFKRMNREFLVLIESEVESRDAWITKNEAKMSLPPAGDAQDLEGFLQLKDAHDGFLGELKNKEMSEFAKDAESMIDLNKTTVAKIHELKVRWSVLLNWATERTVYLNTVIGNWQEYKQHEVTATDFIDSKERGLQAIDEKTDDEVTKDKVEQLENMQGETRENSLEIWKVQRQSTVLVKSIGGDAPASKNVEQETKDLVERNEKLSQHISDGINGTEANQHKAKKLREHIESVNNWTTSTTVFIEQFNEVASTLPSSETPGTEAVKGDDEGGDKTIDANELRKAMEEHEENIKTANELIHKIAARRVDIGEYQASVDRINERHAELSSKPEDTSELDVKVEELNTTWQTFNTAVDKIAWMKKPGLGSLQAVTYILHDMKINKVEDSLGGVETFDQWKEKASELESSVSEVEGKFKPEKDMKKDYGQIQAVFSNIQECEKEIDEKVLPQLETIRVAGAKVCSPPEGSTEPVTEEMKSEISTTVLSLHVKIETLNTVIQLQRLRLEDTVHEYFHERVRLDQRLLAQEQTENKRLFPVGEDIETIILHLEIIKESEEAFNANQKTFKETQQEFKELNDLKFINDQELIVFVTEKVKNLEIQRETVGKLYSDIEQKLRGNLISKFNSSKSKFNKWLKSMEKRERSVDSEVEGVEKSLAECAKLESVAEDLSVGEEIEQRVVKLLVQINIEVMWSEAELESSRADVNSLSDRHTSLMKNIDDKRNGLQAKVKESLDGTLGVAEKSISEAEAWEQASILSEDLEQATVQIQQSMENVTIANNLYTQTMQSLKRPEEIAQSGVLSAEINADIQARCHDLTKRVGRLPSIVLKNHKSLFEAFTQLLHDVVNEREHWISHNESNVMVSFVSVASLEDLKNKIQENKEFMVEIKKHDMELVIIELEKMSFPDFKLKATSTDLQSRLAAIERSAQERDLVLLSILQQWEAMREKLKELLDWIEMKDLKLGELKEQVNLADEEEVKGELTELKKMQTEMEDKYPEVVNFKKMGEGLKKILGDECEASERVDEQVTDFMGCWSTLADDIQGKIRKLECSERQLSTMHRYMDSTHDWMDDLNDILDQHAANERRLQGLPAEDEPKDSETEPTMPEEVEKDSEGEPKDSEDEPKDSEGEPKDSEDEPKDSEDEPIVSVEMADVSEVEPEMKELSEDEKAELRQENKNLVEAFVMKRQRRATCQAFVDWAGELGQKASEDLDEESKEILKIRIEKFQTTWDEFAIKTKDFSQNNSEDIELIQFQLAEQLSEDLPDTVTFEEWKTEISVMDEWFIKMVKKCSDVSISRDSDSLKKGEQDTKTILLEFNNEGKPRYNKIVVLGRKLIDAKSQTPEEEQEITVIITKFTKRITEVERTVELHRIRTLETIVDYCQEKLSNSESAVERDEVNMTQLTPSGSTPEAVHEQIVLLKICEVEVPQHEEEFVEIQRYITETRHPGFISYETHAELLKTCKTIEKRRTEVDKQMKESHNRLHRVMVNFFEQRKKITLKWLANCERKERQVKPDVKELKDSKSEYIKVKEVRTEFDGGRSNLVGLIEVHKLVVADDIMDSKRSADVEKDVNAISGRVEQVDKILHEQETKLYTTLLATLTQLLDAIETSLSDARSGIKPDEVISTYFKIAKKQMEETKVMAHDIQVIHLASNRQLEQAEEVKKARLLGPEDADTNELRLSDLTKKSADLHEAAQVKESRMRVEYVTTFKTELQRCSQWITFLELRVEKSEAEAEDYPGYQQLREDHIHFEEDLKVYDLNMLVREVDKIDDLEVCVKQELAAMEKRWKKLLKWSDERALRLSKIVSIWSKFRQEEIAILNWIDEKNEQLKVSDAVNMADEGAVSAQLDVLKSLNPERDEYVSRSSNVEDMGHELKRIVGDNTKAGELIQKQMVDLDDVFNELIKQIVQKIVQLESAQRRLQSISEEMDIVNTWCNETDVLLDEYDVMEGKLQEMNVGYKSGEPAETGEQEGKETKREKRARMKEEKALLREEMIQQIEKLSAKYEKLQINESKVKRVNEMGCELKEEIPDDEKQNLEAKLQPFNERFSAVSQRLKDMANKDLPESSGCWFVRFMRRKLFRASIN